MLTTWVYHRRKDMNGQVEYFFLGMIPLRSCQHVFCLSCISRALANKAECPLCREEMHVLRLRRCQPLQALVDEVQVPGQLSWQSFHFWILQKFRIPILGYPKIFHVWENDDQNRETSCHIFTQHVLKRGPADFMVRFLSEPGNPPKLVRFT